MPFNVSSFEHNALILLTEIASAKGLVSLDAVAKRMCLSQGYLEEVAHALKTAKLIRGRQGRGGGYLLARPASKISLSDVMSAVNGPLELVSCQSAKTCPVSGRCQSKQAWADLRRTIDASLEKITLESIVKGN